MREEAHFTMVQVRHSGCKSPRMLETPILVDTTLREGNQSAGLRLAMRDRIELVRRMSLSGIREIEVGIPVMGGEESECIRRIVQMNLPARILTWNRALEGDLDASFRLGVRNVFISIPVSELHIQKKLNSNRQAVLERLAESVSMARQEGCYVVAGLEDASRADLAFLDEVCDLLRTVEADRIRIADTVGILTPERTQALFSHLTDRIPTIPFEMHAHNDFGLATANTVAAYLAGARYLDTTLMGVGERAGNAAMEEVLLTLEVLYNRPTGFQMDRLQELVEFFSLAGNIPIPLWKSGVGRYAFTHSSGLHVDGMLKDPGTYEPFLPEKIGQRREFIIGKSSGRSAVIHKAADLGIGLTKTDADRLVQALRPGAASLSDEAFRSLITRTLGR